jgi:hypothetical protein
MSFVASGGHDGVGSGSRHWLPTPGNRRCEDDPGGAAPTTNTRSLPASVQCSPSLGRAAGLDALVAVAGTTSTPSTETPCIAAMVGTYWRRALMSRMVIRRLAVAMKPRDRSDVIARTTVSREAAIKLASSSWVSGTSISTRGGSARAWLSASSRRKRASRWVVSSDVASIRRRSAALSRRMIQRSSISAMRGCDWSTPRNPSPVSSRHSTRSRATLAAVRGPLSGSTASNSPSKSPGPSTASMISRPSGVTSLTFTRPATRTNTVSL